MSSQSGISLREFARRDGCSDTLVRKALKSGDLIANPDGSISPALVGTGWRLSNRRAANAAKVQPGETVEQAAERIVVDEGHAPHTLAEAERIKENFLAKLKELEFDIKSGAVVLVEDVAQMVASEYAVVRNRLMSIAAEIAPKLAILRTAPEVQAALEAEHALALESLTLDAGAEPDDLGRKVRQRKGKAH